MTTIAELNDLAGPLAELLKQVKTGNEVLLTQGNRPVARLVPASKERAHFPARFGFARWPGIGC